MATILIIVKSPYLSEKSSDFDEIRHTTANGKPLTIPTVTGNGYMTIVVKFYDRSATVLESCSYICRVAAPCNAAHSEVW